MQHRIRPGIDASPHKAGRLSGSTFIELVVTMLLLVLFAALAFPLYWSTNKATAAHEISDAAQRSRLSLVTFLPRLTNDVRPPYWENPDKVFSSSGDELTAQFYGGNKDESLKLRKESDSRLSLTTPSLTLSIDNLPGVAIDWWKKEDRIVGFTVSWRQGSDKEQFHAAWGSFTL
jgi:hypothetical protein